MSHRYAPKVRPYGNFRDTLVSNWGVPRSFIKSIQYISVSLNGGSTSGTATITSVVTDNSFIMWLGDTSDGTNPAQSGTSWTLTNATTATLARGSSTNAATGKGLVIEFVSGVILSLQNFTVSITGANATATINAVGTTKSIIALRGYSGTTSSSLTTDKTRPHVTLTDSTTVTAVRNTNDSFQVDTLGTVVEFRF